jgi:hypothetical protein
MVDVSKMGIICGVGRGEWVGKREEGWVGVKSVYESDGGDCG